VFFFFFVGCSIDGFGLFSSSEDVALARGRFRKYLVRLILDTEAILFVAHFNWTYCGSEARHPLWKTRRLLKLPPSWAVLNVVLATRDSSQYRAQEIVFVLRPPSVLEYELQDESRRSHPSPSLRLTDLRTGSILA
jgi:hypothetical protein